MAIIQLALVPTVPRLAGTFWGQDALVVRLFAPGWKVTSSRSSESFDEPIRSPFILRFLAVGVEQLSALVTAHSCHASPPLVSSPLEQDHLPIRVEHEQKAQRTTLDARSSCPFWCGTSCGALSPTDQRARRRSRNSVTREDGVGARGFEPPTSTV